MQRTSAPGSSARVPVESWYLSNFSANVALALLGLATGIIAARLLGPQGRGELAAIQLIPYTLAGIALLGLGDSLTYYSSREPNRRGIYVATSVLIASAASLPFIVLGQVVVPWVLTDYSDEIILAAQIYLLYFLINALVGLPYQALRGAQFFRAWNALRILPSLSWLLLLLVAWGLGKSAPAWLAFAYLVALALLVIPFAVTIISLIGGRLLIPRLSACRSLINYGLPSSLAAIPQIITSRVDQIAIAATLSSESLGLYAVALGCSGLASPLTSALSALVLPIIALRQDNGERLRVFAKAARTGLLVAGVAGIAVACATPLLLPLLFGDSFRPAIPAALVLVAASAVVAVNGVLEEGFRGLGHPGFVLRAHLAGAASGTLLVIVLVREYAMIGAAIASFLGATTVALVLLLQARLLLKVSVGQMTVLQAGELAQLARGFARACARGRATLRSGG